MFRGYTHEDYLDADPLWVRWMLEIDALVSERESEQMQGVKTPRVPH